jgi:hypothetical protein
MVFDLSDAVVPGIFPAAVLNDDNFMPLLACNGVTCPPE